MAFLEYENLINSTFEFCYIILIIIYVKHFFFEENICQTLNKLNIYKYVILPHFHIFCSAHCVSYLKFFRSILQIKKYNIVSYTLKNLL